MFFLYPGFFHTRAEICFFFINLSDLVGECLLSKVGKQDGSCKKDHLDPSLTVRP